MKFEEGKVLLDRLELRALVAHTKRFGSPLTSGVHFDPAAGLAFATDGVRLARLNADGDGKGHEGRPMWTIDYDSARVLARIPKARSYKLTVDESVVRAECFSQNVGTICVVEFPRAESPIVNDLVRSYFDVPALDLPRSPVFSIRPKLLGAMRKVKKAAGSSGNVDDYFIAPENALSWAYYVAGNWLSVVMPTRSVATMLFDGQTKSWRDAIAAAKGCAR